jgi:hypothetical protein
LFVVGRKEQRRFADERAFWHPKLIFIENFSCCEGSHCKPDTETHIYGVSGGAESGELAGYRQFLPGFGGILPVPSVNAIPISIARCETFDYLQ